MTNQLLTIILSLTSGLAGAIIGGLIAIRAVRVSRILECEANFRNLLVAQRMAIRFLNTQNAQKRLSDDLLEVFQSYQNLRSIYGIFKRKKLDNIWRAYKGGHEDFVPLFGEVHTIKSSNSISCTTESYDRTTIMNNIDNFLKFLKI